MGAAIILGICGMWPLAFEKITIFNAKKQTLSYDHEHIELVANVWFYYESLRR